MMNSSKLIRIERRGKPNNRNLMQSEDMLSKSLGDYTGRLYFHRHVSDVSNIEYAGYLLKRSNRPYKSVSPIPEIRNFTDSYEPRLQPMPSTANDVSTSDAYDQAPHSPQHRMIVPDLHVSSPVPDAAVTRGPSSQQAESSDRPNSTAKRGSIEESEKFIESFFGVRLPPLPGEEQQPVDVEPRKQGNSSISSSPISSPPVRVRSAPIRMVSATAPILFNNSKNSDTSGDMHLQPIDSSSLQDDSNNHTNGDKTAHRSLSDGASANDVLDQDGHMWRAKYCVLEAGVLYFYRHETDANSPEAQLEREQNQSGIPSSQQHEQNNNNNNNNTPNNLLARSPIPGRLLYGASRGSSEGADSEGGTGYLWEKRVKLDCVGAVRSAEMEYGKNSFELSAADEEDDDKLVLRAQDADQMNEWLFQFHRSIATFVMDIMDQVTPALGGDLHHPSFAHKPFTGVLSQEEAKYGDDTSTPRHSTQIIAFSPRYQNFMTCGAPTLSHGHGRNSMHRRRISSVTASSVPPDTPLFPIPTRPQSPPRVAVTPSPGLAPSPRQDEFLMEISPELSAPQSACPEMERPTPSKTYIPPHVRNKIESSPTKPVAFERYIPPSLRNNNSNNKARNNEAQKPQGVQQGEAPLKKYIPRHLRQKQGCISAVGLSLEERAAAIKTAPRKADSFDTDEVSCDSNLYESTDDENFKDEFETKKSGEDEFQTIKFGGCADPSLIAGSILDPEYIAKKSSVVGKERRDAFGFVTGTEKGRGKLRWEIGAVSECGVRNSNEDSYLIVKDVTERFPSGNGKKHSTVWGSPDDHEAGLFAIFDGHCGNEAARFAAEKLMHFIENESAIKTHETERVQCTAVIGEILQRAIASLDTEFCNICVDDGRAWESGATAIIAALVNEHLVIANLGDARGVMSRSVAGIEDAAALEASGWNELPFDDHVGSRRCFWQEVTEAHSPGREDERARIQSANGWVTTETEIPIGQLKRMVLFDEDVIDILKRCFSDRYQPSPKAAAPQRILQISRVCGELAVSRAIGDRDFKSSYNTKRLVGTEEPSKDSDSEKGKFWWDCPLFLPYPDDHSRSFVGDLVDNKPDFQSFRVGEEGISDEFLLLACDGLWDVIDSDDAIRVTRDLLFAKQWSAKKAAARLAELAIHLGSSDNVTVIVVRFFSSEEDDSAPKESSK